MTIPWIAAGAALLAVAGSGAQDGDATEPAVRILPHAELASALAALAEAHPEVATHFRVGTSREGRSIDAVRLCLAEDPEAVPAILLVANLEGPRVFESGVALRHAERLAAEHATDAAARALLASSAVWIVPRANPDAAEARFGEPLVERWASSQGIDDDRDGRLGEDGPADVDGDGLVAWMRVEDPEGTWIEDPTDPRALVEADRAAGERGRWKLVREARDADGDGEAGEDPAGDARVDRNFPAGWEEHTPSAGLFATDAPEARALCELVMARRNLALVVLYDGLDSLVGTPETVDDDARPVLRIPPAGVLASDAALLEELGKRYRAATGNETGSAATDAGTFARWCYEHRGLPVLAAKLWELPTEVPDGEGASGGEEGVGEEGADAGRTAEDEAPGAQAEGTAAPAGDAAGEAAEDATGPSNGDAETKEEPAEPSEDAKHLRWIDAAGEGWRFRAWTPFEHPELGPVEIGGFTPWARVEPPRDVWDAIADGHHGWLLGLGELPARVTIASCTAERLGEGVWRVEAVLENEGYLPLLTRSMRRTETTRPARVRLVLPEAATLLAGGAQELVDDLPGSGGRRELTWLVHGPPGIELGVEVDTDHATDAFRQAEVTE